MLIENKDNKTNALLGPWDLPLRVEIVKERQILLVKNRFFKKSREREPENQAIWMLEATWWWGRHTLS